MDFDITYCELQTWRSANERWGDDHEIGMACEELSEAITALQHVRRGRHGAADEFVSELADGLVCSLQVVESNGLWDELRIALDVSFRKLGDKLKHSDKNHGH
jgi:hypothetical protein